MEKKNSRSIDEYIAGFPEKTRARLEEIRQAIKQSAPGAAETISYGMPAFKLNSVLVYFAGYNNHIGFYPTPSGIAAFAAELTPFQTSKGAVRFPLDQPMPLELVEKIVKFRVAEQSAGNR